jgi:hypothetical protein
MQLNARPEDEYPSESPPLARATNEARDPFGRFSFPCSGALSP